MNHRFLKCAALFPTAVYSTMPNVTFSENSESIKTLLKNKYFVPILATSILGISLLLIRKKYFNFVTFEGSKFKDKKAANNSKDEQIKSTKNHQDEEHKIPKKDTDPETGSDINNLQDVKLGKDNMVQEATNEEANFKDECIKETSASKNKFCALEEIYKKINFLKILVIFSIWYFFRLLVKGVFFCETIFDFEAWATEELPLNKDAPEWLESFRREEKEKKYKNIKTYYKKETGSTFYLKKNSECKDYVILLFNGLGAPPKESACTEKSRYAVATVMHRYTAKENDSIFKKIYNLFMVSESSIYKDAEDLYDYVTDNFDYKKVVIKAFSFGGAVGAHVAKYAEEKAKKKNKENKLERIFIVSSISGIYTSAKQFIYAFLIDLSFGESFCNILKYVGAIIAKFSLFDYSLDSFDSLKKLESKKFPIHVFSGDENDFLNDNATKLSEKLRNVGVENISCTEVVSKYPHNSGICNVDKELNKLNNQQK